MNATAARMLEKPLATGHGKTRTAKDIVISSIKRTFITTPPLQAPAGGSLICVALQASEIKSPSAGHTSIEGNYPGASRGKNRRPGFIPLYGGVLRTANARSAGVVRAASCLIYYGNDYIVKVRGNILPDVGRVWRVAR
ncbi:MAG: hypothetical protein LBI31_05970 [Zoogloeaceae bacterium]|jgi:hypothetical protein|nr:hypothetical protein [Zoogloeaceae bacterium]